MVVFAWNSNAVGLGHRAARVGAYIHVAMVMLVHPFILQVHPVSGPLGAGHGWAQTAAEMAGG